jgi:hypothetical protein
MPTNSPDSRPFGEAQIGVRLDRVAGRFASPEFGGADGGNHGGVVRR